MPKSKKQSKDSVAKKDTASPAFPPQPLVKPQESPEQDDHIPEPFFAVKNADGKPWRVSGRVEGEYEDEVTLNIATDPLDADGQILENGEFNVAYFAPSDFDDKPTRKDYEKYISEKIDHAMDSANVGGVISYDKKRHNEIIRTVRQWAIRVITRSFGLDKPRQKQNMPTDPVSIAKSAKSEDVRLEASYEITDQVVLADIAQHDESDYVRSNIVSRRLTEHAVLASIAKNDKAERVRSAAISKLTDQALLAGIAQKDKSASVRAAAVKKLTDQALLQRILKKDKETEVRRGAIRNITDQVFLAGIAKNDKDSDVRAAAVEELNESDQALLASIARKDKGARVRIAAVDKLTDQALLVSIANNNEYWDVRSVTVRKLIDRAVLTAIAKNDENQYVREAAAKRLTEIK